MKRLLTVLTAYLISLSGFSQVADYIVIKKHNNRTLKTYSAGGFISAETYDGFRINGFIKDIRNDSIIFQQRETRVMATEFGTKVDTLSYTLGLNYRIIKKFNFGNNEIYYKKKGFSAISIPRLMIIGGVGYVGLELINTAYRKEPLNKGNKITTLGVAAGAALTGWFINFISNKRNKVGGKYKVVYVKAAGRDNGLK